VKGEIGVGSVVQGSGSMVTVPHAVPTITTSLGVGHYERTSSREGGTWGNAAKNVVEDLKAWVDANRAQLAK
jgi:hypothetical protein